MDKNPEKIIIEVEKDDLFSEEEEQNKIRVLVFSLGKETYCIDINAAREVVRLEKVTKIPNTPYFIVGVMNLRGEIISILDLGQFFNLENRKKTDETRVIVTDVNGPLLGILADDIKATMDVEESSIQPPLSTLDGSSAEYTIGQVKRGKEILVLLDIEKILNSNEIKRLKKGEAQ